MNLAYWVVFACGILAVLYGVFASRSVLAAPTGTDRMREIAAAVQEGAAAYLNRQYRTIGIVGVVICALLFWRLGSYVAIGFVIGAVPVALTLIGWFWPKQPAEKEVSEMMLPGAPDPLVPEARP